MRLINASGWTVLALVLGATTAPAALPPNFVACDLNAALSLAKSEDKITLVYIYRDYDYSWEGRRERNELCRRVEDEVLSQPAVIEAFQPLVCVAASVDDAPGAFERFGIEPGFPTFIWVNTDGTVLAQLGACFDPAAYAAVTHAAIEMRTILRRTDATSADQARLGSLYFDVGRHVQAAEVLRRLEASGQLDAETRIVCAFALRASGEDAQSLEVLNRGLTVCNARGATEAEQGSLLRQPVVGYSPVVLERDGELVGVIYNLVGSKAVASAVQDLEWAATANPDSSAAALRMARVFYEHENWRRAAAAFETALAGELSRREIEEATAKSAIAALFAGDEDGAVKAFDRYLAGNYRGSTRPDALFWAGCLFLRISIQIDERTGDKLRVLDERRYRQASDILVELCQEHPNNAFVPAAKELLVRFYENVPGGEGRGGRN